MTLSSFNKVWYILDHRERRNAIIVLIVMVLSALATAAMVGSILPFLSVLSDPAIIQTNSLYARIYEIGGFTNEYDFVVTLGLLSVSIILLSSLVFFLNTWARSRFTELRRHTISCRLLSHYLSQPYEFFLSRHSAEMSSNILAEADRVVNEVIMPLFTFTSSALTVLALVGMLMLTDAFIATFTLVIIGSVYAATQLFTRSYVARMGRVRADANSHRYRIAGEALAGVKDVKLLGREAAYFDRFGVHSYNTAKAQERVSVIAEAPRFIIQMFGFAGIIVLALVLIDPTDFGNRDALAGLLPLLGVLAFAGQRLLPELQALYQSLTVITAGSASLDRVYADLCSGSRGGLEREKLRPLRLIKELKFHKVNYSYPGAERAGLDDISISIRAGERIGLIGPSGAGKTTLADVILGLLKPRSGHLTVDGEALNDDNTRSWQQVVGYVPQEIFLTDASLAENIAFGVNAREIEHDRVERAARSALLHDFVTTDLPNGYATHIGERGVRLSGGQRQRIGIARALYHDADLILFDEATSALDHLTESEVMAAIEALPGDKTVIIITHRMSTVRRCDRILLIERGKIVGIGPWAQLKKDNKLFQNLTGQPL